MLRKDLVLAYFVGGLLAFLRLLPLQFSIFFMSSLAKCLGPWSSRHKLTLDNLRRAYPDKTTKELKTIARAMWGHMGALFVEYALLDKIVGDPKKIKKHIIVENAAVLQQVALENKPHIFFTAHIGNFELLPILAQQHNVDMSVLFRPPNNRYIADMLVKIRKKFLPHIVSSTYGAVWQLAEALGENHNIGVLVDQKYNRGIYTKFFNRNVKTNPLTIKLAQRFNCDLYPAICLRIGAAKYKIILYEKIQLIRDADGTIDLEANCQMLNNIVETWVRENPQQWMWFHNRWKI